MDRSTPRRGKQSNDAGHRDIAAILKSKKDELDMEYIEGWVTRLGLVSIWRGLLDSVS